MIPLGDLAGVEESYLGKREFFPFLITSTIYGVNANCAIRELSITGDRYIVLGLACVCVCLV